MPISARIGVNEDGFSRLTKKFLLSIPARLKIHAVTAPDSSSPGRYGFRQNPYSHPASPISLKNKKRPRNGTRKLIMNTGVKQILCGLLPFFPNSKRSTARTQGSRPSCSKADRQCLCCDCSAIG